MTSQPLYMKPHQVWGQHKHLTCDISATVWVITSTVETTSHTLFLWHHTRHMCGIICIIQDITSSHFDLKSPFWGHHTHYIGYRVLYICVIPPTLSMISQPLCMISHPVYVRHSVHYIYDIVPIVYENTTLWVGYTTHGICMTLFALEKMSHPLYHTKPQSLWIHIHFRHEITPPYQTSHQLYLCHHNLSADITPTFVWHHSHYMCDIIYTLYKIISTAYVITLLYLWQHKLDIWNHIPYAVQDIHYPCDITVCSLCHHTHCIESITPTLVWHHTRHRYNIFCTIEDITFSLYEIKPPFFRHHTHYIWHHIDAISVITSTLLMISQQLYLWDLILCI